MIKNIFLATTLVSFINGAAHAETEATTLAEFPSGTFLENLDALSNGSIAINSYFAREIWALDIENDVRTLAELDVHPVGILLTDAGLVVTAHGTPFTEGSAFTQTQQVILLSESGEVLWNLAAPDALFLNGMEELPDGSVLIADSIAGTIWRLDVASRTIEPWLQHELLSQNPDLVFFAPGANGLKLHGDRLVISNSGRGALYEVVVDTNGTAKTTPNLVAETGPVDDFIIENDRIIYTTHAEALVSLQSDGSMVNIISEGCGGCTSVLRRGDEYIVLTTGGMLEGHTDPARILSIPTN